MTDDWPTVRLGDCVVVNDDTYSPKEAWPFINYLDTGNITMNRIAEIQQLDAAVDKVPSRARRKVRPGDIVYSMVRPNQRHFGIIKEPLENFLASTGFAVLRGRNGIADTGFLYWYLAQDHIVEQLHTIAEHSTSAYPSIRPADLEQLELRLPPIEEQRRIAGVLGCLDDKIELNRRMAETLEQMARALFRSWFVDFEPVRAKQEARWRPGQSLPGLPAHLYDSFPDHLEPSEQGPIPAGWRVAALGDVANAPRRGVKPEEIDPETPYIGLEHMPRGSIALGEWDTAAKVASGKSAFKRGEILFGKLRPYFHKVGVAPLDGICSTDIIVIEPKAREWASFVLSVVSSDEFVAYANQTSTGTRMPRTSWKAMSAYAVALPPASVAQAFEDAVRATPERIAAQIRESRCLAAQQDVLLPALMSAGNGQVTRTSNGRG